MLVGEDPASQVYVAGKERDCAQVGIASYGARLPASTTQEELHAELDRLNADERVSGIIVQLPLPPHLDPVAAQERVDPRKDVDGLGPDSAGRLLRGDPRYVPATPLGCVMLLESAGGRGGRRRRGDRRPQSAGRSPTGDAALAARAQRNRDDLPYGHP